jgi:cob(I)alamin adenosyltransferase
VLLCNQGQCLQRGDLSAALIKERPLVKIYTRTGDDGITGRIGGRRVSKDTPFIEACGDLDELNALIGLVRTYQLPENIDGILQLIQRDLFTIGAEMATPEGMDSAQEIKDDNVRVLEKEIDSLEDKLAPLTQFILPGGATSGAGLHLVRAVARRAERRCVSLSHIEKINPFILRYLNRLSDLCFVMARYANLQQSIPESNPDFGKPRE